MKRVLALQHIWDDPPGYLGELLQEYSIACDVIAVEHQPIPNPTAYQAIISMGGPQHLYADEHLPYLAQERAILRQAIAQDIPILGICLGGQLLAQALGATIHRHHQAEVGFFQVPLTPSGCQDPLFVGLPGHQVAFQWHEDIFDLPAGAICLARNEIVPNQAFRYGKHSYGLQFHIELNTGIANTWLRLPEFAREIMQTLDDPAAPARLEEEWNHYAPVYQRHTRTLFTNFLHIAGLC